MFEVVINNIKEICTGMSQYTIDCFKQLPKKCYVRWRCTHSTYQTSRVYLLTDFFLPCPTYFLAEKLLVINFQYLLGSVQYLVSNSEDFWNPTPTSNVVSKGVTLHRKHLVRAYYLSIYVSHKFILSYIKFNNNYTVYIIRRNLDWKMTRNPYK